MINYGRYLKNNNSQEWSGNSFYVDISFIQVLKRMYIKVRANLSKTVNFYKEQTHINVFYVDRYKLKTI